MTMAEKNPATVGPWEPFRELDLFRGWPSGRSFEALRDRGLPNSVRWAPSADMSENGVLCVEIAKLEDRKPKVIQVR